MRHARVRAPLWGGVLQRTDTAPEENPLRVSPEPNTRKPRAYHDYSGAYMIPRTVLLLAFTIALTAQQRPPEHPFPPDAEEDVRLPNGKLQREEILKSDYQKTLQDARALSKLANDLKADLEKGGYSVLSVDSLKKTEEIDKLAKRIHDRLKRY
jgi:hypothetical protein